MNGCEVSTTFDYSIDCNGDDYGDAYLDSCGVCSGGNSGHEADSDNLGCGCFNDAALSYWFDIDGDGLGSGVSEDFCLADLPEGWVLNNDDLWPDCFEYDSDGDGFCGDYDFCQGYNDNDDFDLDNIPDGCDLTPYGEATLSYGSVESYGIMEILYTSSVDIHGFQFHPESINTKVGIKLIKNFIMN